MAKRNTLDITGKSLFGESLDHLLMVCAALTTKMLDDVHMSAKLMAKCTARCALAFTACVCSCQFDAC